MKKNDNKSDSEFLRQQAEERLKKKSLAQRGNLSELDSLKLIHELEVHQIELEMQNEELLVARSAAQEAAEKYRELYDFAPMGYCTLSEQGKINEINLYGASLLGKERLHLQGRKFDHSVSIDTKPAFFQFLQDVFSRKTKETCEVALMAKGNSTVLVHLTGISATNGEECLVSLTDITEREKTQGALLLSEKKYHALFENVQDVFYQIDLAGIIQEISPSIKHLAEFNRDEIIGTNVSDIYFSLDDRALFLDEIKKKGEVRDYELTLRTKSGEKRFTSINASLIFDADGKPNHIDGAIRDISDRKKMNEEVIKAKNELEKFFNLVPDLVAVASSDGHLKNLNPEWEKVLGYSVQELLSKPLESFIHPDDIASTRAEISRQLKGGKTISFINRYRHKDGSYRWLEWNATPALDNLLYAAARDITERKIAKQALTESEEKYRSLFENVQDVFYQIDLNGIIIDLSPSIKHFSEFNRDELIGTNVSGLYSNPDDRKILLKELYEKGKVGDYELILKTKSGKTKVVSMNTSLIFDVDGKPHHIDGSIRDISDRKLAEEKVREKDIQFRKLSSNLPDLIYQFTRRSDGTYYVPIASEGIKNIFGCSPEDVVDDFAPIGRVIFPEDAERVISDIEYSAKHLTYFTCEFRVQIPDKPIQWIFSRSTPEKLADGSITWYGFNADITEMKQTERELIKAKEQAEQSDRLKSAFLANMSHEIRTPMNGILGFAELLKEPHLTDDEQQEYITVIERSGKRMLNIINDIVSISKIESGQMEVSIKETNINEQIEFISTFFAPEADKKGIQFLVARALPSIECRIKTDREKIYGILTNLVGNAIKHTQTGSVELGVEKKGQYLEFYVKDTGIGVNDHHKEIIFERFRQGDDLTKQFTEGTGLGLSISKAYVEMLGGEIWLESELGKGSTFYFTIPCNVDSEAKPSIKNGSAITEADHQGKSLKILIAEDDESSVSFLSTALKMYRSEILTVGTGIEAVEACRNHPDIDLVLMDIRMPDLDGYSATRQIRQFNKDVIIIAQTAYAMAGDREKAIEAGCTDHIGKPITMGVLKGLMEKYFGKQQ